MSGCIYGGDHVVGGEVRVLVALISLCCVRGRAASKVVGWVVWCCLQCVLCGKIICRGRRKDLGSVKLFILRV